MTRSCTTPVRLVAKTNFSKTRPIFLDADGVLWQDFGAGSIFRPDSIESFVSQVSLVHALFPLSPFFVISNQTCVARGMCSEDSLRKRIKSLLDSVLKFSPSIVFSYCPHHPSAQELAFRKNCGSRKPNSDQIAAILEEFDLDIQQSIFIGDRITDLEAAEKLGIREKYLIANARAFEENELGEEFIWSQSVEFRIISNLLDLAKFV